MSVDNVVFTVKGGVELVARMAFAKIDKFSGLDGQIGRFSFDRRVLGERVVVSADFSTLGGHIATIAGLTNAVIVDNAGRTWHVLECSALDDRCLIDARRVASDAELSAFIQELRLKLAGGAFAFEAGLIAKSARRIEKMGSVGVHKAVVSSDGAFVRDMLDMQARAVKLNRWYREYGRNNKRLFKFLQIAADRGLSGLAIA